LTGKKYFRQPQKLLVLGSSARSRSYGITVNKGKGQHGETRIRKEVKLERNDKGTGNSLVFILQRKKKWEHYLQFSYCKQAGVPTNASLRKDFALCCPPDNEVFMSSLLSCNFSAQQESLLPEDKDQ